MAVAFAVKATILFIILPMLGKTVSPLYGIGFADDYDKLAFSLAEGNGYRFYPDTADTLMREPGYPFFLAAIFSIFGYSLQAARFANLILVLCIAWLMVRLARKVSLENTTTAFALLLFFLHPGTLVAEARGGVEILFVLLVMLFMLILYNAIEGGAWKHYVLAGVVLGLAVLVRSTVLLFPIFLIGYVLFSGRTRSEKFKMVANLGALVLAMLVIMAPWIVRNYALVGQFVPTASVQGVSAHAGQYICRNLSFESGFQALDSDAARERGRLARQLGYSFRGGYYQYFYDSNDEVAFNGFLLRKVVNGYLADPGLFLKCATANLFNFWFSGKTWQGTWLNIIVQLPYLLLAIAGAYLLIRAGQGPRVYPIVLFIVYVMLVHAPIHSQARYSVPLVPFISMLAAVAIRAALERRTATARESWNRLDDQAERRRG